MRWTKGLLVPERLQLRATANAAGARAARLLYQQRRHRALSPVATWGRSLALSKGVGLRCGPPVDGFDDLCDLLGVEPLGGAAIRSWQADRMVICIVGRAASVVVKVGSHRDVGLSTEGVLLGKLTGITGTVLVPQVRWHGTWREYLILATEAIQLADRQGDVPIELAADTATSLSLGSSTVGPLVHGDLTPWNLLRTRNALALVDWERGRVSREPLFDLANFVVMRSALLRRDQPERALAQLTAPGSLGWRHLAALDVDPSTAPALLRDYLERTWHITESTRAYRKALSHLLTGASGHSVSHSATK